MKSRGEIRRAKLRAMMAAAQIDGTNLARAIGRSKEYITDYMKGTRKQDISADAWDDIVALLGDPDSTDKIAVEDVRAAVEPLLALIAGNPEAANYAIESLLEVLRGRQSLPAGVSRDAAIRLLSHQIAMQLGPKSDPAKH